MTQPSTLAPEGRIPAQKCFDSRLDPFCRPAFMSWCDESALHYLQGFTSHKFRCDNLISIRLEKCIRVILRFGNAITGETGYRQARIPLPAKAGSPLREFLWILRFTPFDSTQDRQDDKHKSCHPKHSEASLGSSTWATCPILM